MIVVHFFHDYPDFMFAHNFHDIDREKYFLLAWCIQIKFNHDYNLIFHNKWCISNIQDEKEKETNEEGMTKSLNGAKEKEDDQKQTISGQVQKKPGLHKDCAHECGS